MAERRTLSSDPGSGGGILAFALCAWAVGVCAYFYWETGLLRLAAELLGWTP